MKHTSGCNTLLGAGGHAALTQLQLMERLGTLPTKLAQQPWSAPSVVTQLTPERLQVGRWLGAQLVAWSLEGVGC
jgi:glycerol-3-phosphate O-acyltransferase